jgi:hypothetical protein
MVSIRTVLPEAKLRYREMGASVPWGVGLKSHTPSDLLTPLLTTDQICVRAHPPEKAL